jgi:hypothetical protein
MNCHLLVTPSHKRPAQPARIDVQNVTDAFEWKRAGTRHPEQPLFSFRQQVAGSWALDREIVLIATDRVVQDSEHQALNRIVVLAPVHEKLFGWNRVPSNGASFQSKSLMTFLLSSQLSTS